MAVTGDQTFKMPAYILMVISPIKNYIDISVEFPKDVGTALAKAGNKSFAENLQQKRTWPL